MLYEIFTTIFRIGLAVAAPLIVIMLIRYYYATIQPHRKRTGYVVDYSSHGGYTIGYYEGDKELHFFSDDSNFLIPSEALWDDSLPEFFKGRQSLIVKRLKYYMPSSIKFEFIDSFPDGVVMHYVDESQPSGEKRISRIGGITTSSE